MSAESPLVRRSRRSAIAGLLSLTACGIGAGSAFGQQASRSIFVPFSPGGGSDLLVRRVAQSLQEGSGIGYRVVNNPGAGGVIAAQQLLRSGPEEASLLWANSGLVCNTPLLSKPPLQFDPVVDFVPVCIVARAPLLLVSSGTFPAGNLAELQLQGRREGGAVQYASNEAGSAPHLAAETLLRLLGVSGAHVPYRLLNQAVLDVAEGRVALGVFNWQYVVPYLKSGKLKIISVLASSPLAVAPDLPTVASQGYGEFDVQGWFGFFASRAAPAHLLQDHERRIVSILRAEDMARFVASLGYEPFLLGSVESAGFIRREVARNRQIMSRLGLI